MAFVCRGNWDEEYKKAVAHLQQADFVAIDCEMSGVETTTWRAGSQVDTLETRYLNLRDSANKFGLLQFGLCPFIWESATSKYQAHPYNFSLFPRNELPVHMPARDFLCQATSLEFLAKHKFNFNACIHDGISFLSRQEEKDARFMLGLDGEPKPEKQVDEIPLTRTADVMFSENVRADVGQWWDSVLHENKEDKERPCFLVQVNGNRQANLVHQLLRKSFKDLIPITEEGTKRVKVLFPRSTEERVNILAQLQEEKRQRSEAHVFGAVGFRHMIDALVSSGKPIVGHNCFLDLAHVYCKFFAPLPPSCDDFCSSIRRHFGCIVDTKYVLLSSREFSTLKSTSLGVAYEELKDKAAHVEMTYSRYANDADLKHEAGYDAYMTGVVYANMCGILKVKPGGMMGGANLVYLGWHSRLVLDITTGREATNCNKSSDSAPSRTAILWGGCCKELEKHVRDSFHNFQGISFEIHGVDEDCAFLIFQRKLFLDAFVQAFEASEGCGDSCNVNKLLMTGLKVARFETFQSLCQTPLSTPKLGDALDLLLYAKQHKNNIVNNIMSNHASSRKRARHS